MEYQYLTIDERGDLFFNIESPQIADLDLIEELQKNIKLNDDFLLTTKARGLNYLIESFDHPLLIVHLEIKNKKILLHTKYQIIFEANMQKWSVDSWDRFNGLTTSGAPFVLTETAQNKLFNSVDSFDDDGFEIAGKFIPTPPYFIDTPNVETSNYWQQIYQTEDNPGWNLNEPAEAFKDMLPRLKLPKSRILVIGSGEGHDAAFFAKVGHVVTAVDFSAEAIKRGQKKYGEINNLQFVQADVFNLPTDWNYSFDLIIEHTCFCAIAPDQRDDLIKIYRRLLHEEGQLMAVFYTMDKRSGPPFGATEWEIRKRTQNYFQYIFWGRLRNSIPRRQGRELFVLAKKRA